MSSSIAQNRHQSDWLHIRELSVLAQIGCSEEERSFPQRILLNIDVSLDLREAARTKDLNQTICYVTLKDALASFIRSRSWVLLEELAAACSDLIFQSQPLAQQVDMQIRKYVTTDTAWVGISISRQRANL